MTFYIYDDYSQINSLASATANNIRYASMARSTTCQGTTIDAHCAQSEKKHISLLKIDVEGAELSVLQGARHMLRSGSIDYVYAEFNEILPIDGVIGGALTPLAHLLAPFGFHYLATYTDWVEPVGDHIVVSNILFERRWGDDFG